MCYWRCCEERIHHGYSYCVHIRHSRCVVTLCRETWLISLTDQLHDTQSVKAFELRGILYALGSGPDSESYLFTDDIRSDALFDGVANHPSSWEVEQKQHCVRAAWKIELPPSLRSFTFEIIASSNVALFVQSAGLRYLAGW